MSNTALGEAPCSPGRYVPTALEIAQQNERDLAYARQNALNVAAAVNADPERVVERARAYAEFLING